MAGVDLKNVTEVIHKLLQTDQEFRKGMISMLFPDMSEKGVQRLASAIQNLASEVASGIASNVASDIGLAVSDAAKQLLGDKKSPTPSKKVEVADLKDEQIGSLDREVSERFSAHEQELRESPRTFAEIQHGGPNNPAEAALLDSATTLFALAPGELEAALQDESLDKTIDRIKNVQMMTLTRAAEEQLAEQHEVEEAREDAREEKEHEREEHHKEHDHEQQEEEHEQAQSPETDLAKVAILGAEFGILHAMAEKAVELEGAEEERSGKDEKEIAQEKDSQVDKSVDDKEKALEGQDKNKAELQDAAGIDQKLKERDDPHAKHEEQKEDTAKEQSAQQDKPKLAPQPMIEVNTMKSIKSPSTPAPTPDISISRERG